MRSYRAFLQGDRFEWLEEAPELQKDVPLNSAGASEFRRDRVLPEPEE